jgi:hypothetical protein
MASSRRSMRQGRTAPSSTSRRALVGGDLAQVIELLDPDFTEVSAAGRAALDQARQELLAE